MSIASAHRIIETPVRASLEAPLSGAFFERAKRVLAGGISSSARSTTSGDLKHPLYIAVGSGGKIWDIDGNVYVDFLMSYGSLPLGHGNEAVRLAAHAQLDVGTMFGTCNIMEVELAEQICRMVPCAQLVRFANSGSEAICGAIRAARGFTGKSKILKFEGHYHGWVDVLAVSNRPTEALAGPPLAPHSVPHSRGIPSTVVDDVIIAPWNDPVALKMLLDAHQHELAAIIAEPVVANNACTLPAPGFLELMREECSRRGMLLIFDEIVTGFRLAPGGAQEMFGVLPDLVVLSKAMGGGFPISAFAGTREVMTPISQNTVKHGGTYNGNPFSASAALATLQTIALPATLRRTHAVGQALMDEIRRSARDFDVPCVVQGVGSMFQVIFGLTSPPSNYRDLLAADTKRYAFFHDSLLNDGIFANASGMACWFPSSAHTDDEVKLACAAIRRGMAALT